MDVEASDNLTQMRMIHYMASENAAGTWRAGNHTDVGCLTLLFQRDGEDGLEVCPGRKNHNDKIIGDDFSPIPAKTGPIVVNIGDMLSKWQSYAKFCFLRDVMSRHCTLTAFSSPYPVAWSDDRLKANFHRVRAQGVGPSPDRYSIAYFNTGRRNVVMQGPLKK